MTNSSFEHDVLSVRMASAEGVDRARTRLHSYLTPTPLYRSAALSRALRADVWLKVETVSPIASFKLRGALNALIQNREENANISCAITSSTGNHGQGVALAASWLDIDAEIFVPENGEAIKRTMIRLFGAKLHVGGHDLDDAKERARNYAAQRGGTFVDDGEDIAVIEGAGTIGIEIAEALRDIDLLFVPMGSGSLASGTAIGLKASQPDAKVIAVQSAGAPAMVESFNQGRMVERPANTIAGSLVCRVPAEAALTALLRHVDECRLVSDIQLLASVNTLLSWGHVLVEPGAAAGLAAAWNMRDEIVGKRVVLVLSGANIDDEMLHRAIATRPLFDVEIFSL